MQAMQASKLGAVSSRTTILLAATATALLAFCLVLGDSSTDTPISALRPIALVLGLGLAAATVGISILRRPPAGDSPADDEST